MVDRDAIRELDIGDSRTAAEVRMGHATALLDALELAEPAERLSVSTGTANIPALMLYRRHGFASVGTREVAPGVTVTLLERRTQHPD